MFKFKNGDLVKIVDNCVEKNPALIRAIYIICDINKEGTCYLVRPIDPLYNNNVSFPMTEDELEKVILITENELKENYTPNKKTYEIKYTETYEKVYEIEACSEDEAIDLLISGISNGVFDTPDECSDTNIEVL